MRLLLTTLILVPSLLSQAPQSIGSWPGLWGPSRNATAAAGSTFESVREVWRRPTQGGYSEIAVSGDLAVTLELASGHDALVAVDAATGRERWRVVLGQTYKGHGGSDDGPIATPAIGADDVIALGPHGVLVSVDRRTGAERWRHDLVRAFGATAPTWGFAASPLIEGGVVILQMAGPGDRAGLVAFNRKTGARAWRVPLGGATAYTSAVAMTIGGVRQIVAATTEQLIGVGPNGHELWRAAGPGGRGEMSNSPILIGADRILTSTWEESRLVRVTRGASAEAFEVTEVWRTPLLRGANGPAFHRDGFLYGFAGAFFVCLDAGTATVRWRERTGAGTLIAAGDRLLLLSADTGELRVVQPSPERYVETAKHRVLGEGRAVTGPSLAGGRLFVRNLREMAAFAVDRASR